MLICALAACVHCPINEATERVIGTMEAAAKRASRIWMHALDAFAYVRVAVAPAEEALRRPSPPAPSCLAA